MVGTSGSGTGKGGRGLDVGTTSDEEEGSEWELRSIMVAHTETHRPPRAERAKYTHTENLDQWLLRLAGWGNSQGKTPQADPAKDGGQTRREDVSFSGSVFAAAPSVCVPSYDFTRPGEAVNKSVMEAVNKSVMTMTAAIPANTKKELLPGGAEDNADTPPSKMEAGGTETALRPGKILKLEFARLKATQAPYLEMKAFLNMEEGRRSVDPALVLLDMSRARILPNNDYYHASLVDGFSRRKQFLLAQAPSRGNIKAFWSLLHSYSVRLLVVLGCGSLNHDFWGSGEEATEKLWEGGSVNITREGIVHAAPGFRFLQIRAKVDGVEERVDVMEMPWEVEELVPMDLLGVAGRMLACHESILNLLSREEKEKGKGSGKGETSGKSLSPLAIVCPDGTRRSGTLAAAAIALERLMVTGLVELAETAKALRLQRFGCLHHGIHFLQLHLLFIHHLGIQGKLGLPDPVELERLEGELAYLIRDVKAYREALARPTSSKSFFRTKSSSHSVRNPATSDGFIRE